MKLDKLYSYRSLLGEGTGTYQFLNPCCQFCRILASIPNVYNPNGSLGNVIDEIVVLIDRDGTIHAFTVRQQRFWMADLRMFQ